MAETYREVGYGEFYDAIGERDVVLDVQGKYPYTIHFMMRRTRKIVGKSVDVESAEPGGLQSKYFLVVAN